MQTKIIVFDLTWTLKTQDAMFAQLYSLLSCIDPIMLTNFFMIPSVLKSYYVEHYATCALGFCAVLSSTLYHESKETKYHCIDVFFARLNVLWFFAYYAHESSLMCRVSLAVALITYLLAKTGGPFKRNQTYVFWHSIFHVCISIASFTAI